jgi:hypothetical protein
MTITITTESYNDRRYGKPWIALVDFAAKSTGEFKWGEFLGDSRGGELTIECSDGDIVASGQKDHRKPQYSKPDFYMAIDGHYYRKDITTAADARRWWKAGAIEYAKHALTLYA